MVERSPRLPDLHVVHVSRVSAGEMAPLLDELSKDFWGIRIYKENWRPAAGGLGIPESAVEIAFAVAAASFLKALGEDLYKRTRDLVWERYKAWTNPPDATILYRPLTLIFGKPGAGYYFVLDEGLTRDNYEAALRGISQEIDAHEFPEEHAEPWWYEFTFDTGLQRWHCVYQEVGGRVLLNDREAQNL